MSAPRATRECPEILHRRFWININSNLFIDDQRLNFKSRFIRKESISVLIGIGFRQDRQSRNYTYKSTSVRKILRAYHLLQEILDTNGYSSQVIQISTQPICRSCGKLLKFSARECSECGSRNIEPAGRFDPVSCKITFEGKKGERN